MQTKSSTSERVNGKTAPHPEGKFRGTIKSVSHEQDTANTGGLFMCFDIVLENGATVTARHRTHGEYARISRDMLRECGLDWPSGIMQIGKLVGLGVPVVVKHKAKTSGEGVFVNAYINFPRTKPATPDMVAQVVQKMADDPETVF